MGNIVDFQAVDPGSIPAQRYPYKRLNFSLTVIKNYQTYSQGFAGVLGKKSSLIQIHYFITFKIAIKIGSDIIFIYCIYTCIRIFKKRSL